MINAVQENMNITFLGTNTITNNKTSKKTNIKTSPKTNSVSLSKGAKTSPKTDSITLNKDTKPNKKKFNSDDFKLGLVAAGLFGSIILFIALFIDSIISGSAPTKMKKVSDEFMNDGYLYYKEMEEEMARIRDDIADDIDDIADDVADDIADDIADCF